MKIAIDAACWNNRRGFGRFTRELIGAMAAARERRELIVVTDSETAESAAFSGGLRVCDVRVTKAPLEAASAQGSRSLLDLWRFRRAVAGLKPDVVFFPAVYSYFPVAGRVPTLVAFHDVIAETHPDHIFPSKRARWLWDRKVRAALRRSQCIATVSEDARTRIAETFGRDSDEIAVIGEGVDDRFHPRSKEEQRAALEQLGLPIDQPLLLYVGGVSPHKNLATLIRSLRSLADRGQTHWRMVFVGEVEGDAFYSSRDEVRRVISECGLKDQVTFTGYVSDEMLAALYSAARVLVLPSLDEGFGLPAAEAMACGTPVAASRAGALPEVVGDAGLLYNPVNVAEMADVLGRLLTDHALHAACSAAGMERARRHRWSSVAEKVFSELDRIVASR